MNSQHMRHISDMWDEINTLHSSYLQTEECLAKIGEQTRLEGVIRQYLYLAPHIKKFFFPKISFALHNSVQDKKDFSPFKAISAWSALAKYAHNILTQPWRKEFYAVQKYGGYFSHVIKEVLVDWEIVFQLMGYNTSRDIMILQEPIDPDKITFVALDCFIAQVECQIMMKIYFNVLKMHNDCTWHQVLEFRESHICSDEQAIRSLCTMFMQKQQDEYAREVNIPQGPPYGYATLPPYHQAPCIRYHNDYKQNTSYGNSIANLPPHSKMSHDNCDFVHLMSQDYGYPNCQKHIAPNTMPLSDAGCIQEMVLRDSAYGLPYADKPYYPPYIYPPNNLQYLGVDMEDREVCSNCHGCNYGAMYPIVYGNNKFSDRTFDNHKQRSKNIGKYDNSHKQSAVDNQYTTRKSKESYLPLNVKSAPVSLTDLENAMKAFSLDFDKSTISDNEQSEESVKLNAESDNLQLSINNSDNFTKRDTVYWECKTCTYHNSSQQSICELCGKSRNAGNEKVPLISGGRQCPKCTLVNERDAMTCEACNNNLKDSPTYI